MRWARQAGAGSRDGPRHPTAQQASGTEGGLPEGQGTLPHMVSDSSHTLSSLQPAPTYCSVRASPASGFSHLSCKEGRG